MTNANKAFIVGIIMYLLLTKEASAMNGKLTRYPLDSWRQSSGFGWRLHPVIKDENGNRARRHHNGLDMAEVAGAPVYAAGDGTVIKAALTSGGYGNKVEIDHGNGLVTKYGHMLELPMVKAGDIVKAGTQIGKVGSTGMSTGNHLHFETVLNGKPVDPELYLPGITKR